VRARQIQFADVALVEAALDQSCVSFAQLARCRHTGPPGHPVRAAGNSLGDVGLQASCSERNSASRCCASWHWRHRRRGSPGRTDRPRRRPWPGARHSVSDAGRRRRPASPLRGRGRRAGGSGRSPMPTCGRAAERASCCSSPGLAPGGRRRPSGPEVGSQRPAQQHVEHRRQEQAESVTPIIPANTATPMALRISAPAPVDSTSGSTPMMKASEVIRIGRRRRRLASMAACTGLRPANSSSRANSTIRIAFLPIAPPAR
jgi:hypothetical protein